MTTQIPNPPGPATQKELAAYHVGFQHGMKKSHPYEPPDPTYSAKEKAYYSQGFDDAVDLVTP